MAADDKTRHGNAKESVEKRGNADADARDIMQHTPDENIGASSGAENYKD